MNQNTDARKLPAWTLLVSVPGRLAALTILWKCHDFGLSCGSAWQLSLWLWS